MSISQRLKQLVESEGRQSVVAEKAGIKDSTLSRIINQGALIRSDTLEAILRAYPGLNARWLLTGEGPMWEGGAGKTPSATGRNKPATQQREGDNVMTRMVQLLEQRIQTLEDAIAQRDPELARKLGIGK